MDELTPVVYANQPLDVAGQCAVPSAHDFETTVSRLVKAIADADLRLIHEIDPQAQLRKGGFAIEPTHQFLFFHPRFMARILTADPRAAIETPLKFTVMTLADGSVLLRYADPLATFGPYAGLEGLGRELSEICAGRLAAAIADPAQKASPAALPEIVSTNPATGEILARLKAAGAEEIDKAVARARAGQAQWRALTGAARGRVLRRVADILRARNDELAHLETLDTGKPIAETSVVDVISGAECLEYYAGLAAGIAGEHIDLGPTAFSGYSRPQKPRLQASWRASGLELSLADRLLEGGAGARLRQCDDFQTLRTDAADGGQKLAEIMREAGVPEGVFTVVQGAAETGKLLVAHPDIRKVSLTGDVRTGKRIMAAGAETLKYVTLELGGKSPILVFDDADIDDAVSGAILGNFYSGGEICSNGTRVFVQRGILGAFREKLIARAEQHSVDRRSARPEDPDRRVDLARAYGKSPRRHRARPARGRAPADRRQTLGGRCIGEGLVRRSDDIRGGGRQFRSGPRGNIRSRHDDPPLRRRAGGRAARQRYALWALGRRLHARHRTRAQGDRSARSRHVLDQPL